MLVLAVSVFLQSIFVMLKFRSRQDYAHPEMEEEQAVYDDAPYKRTGMMMFYMVQYILFIIFWAILYVGLTKYEENQRDE